MYEFGQFSTARIWVGQSPRTAEYKGQHAIEQVLPVGPAVFNEERIGAVELFIPKGGFAYYGLLGARWRPKAGNTLSIHVPLSGYEGMPVDGNLGTEADDVRAGLPEEYATGVLEGLCGEAIRLGAGEMVVTHAAHGKVGSNLVVFRWLGKDIGKSHAFKMFRRNRNTPNPG